MEKSNNRFIKIQFWGRGVSYLLFILHDVTSKFKYQVVLLDNSGHNKAFPLDPHEKNSTQVQVSGSRSQWQFWVKHPQLSLWSYYITRFSLGKELRIFLVHWYSIQTEAIFLKFFFSRSSWPEKQKLKLITKKSNHTHSDYNNWYQGQCLRSIFLFTFLNKIKVTNEHGFCLFCFLS